MTGQDSQPSSTGELIPSRVEKSFLTISWSPGAGGIYFSTANAVEDAPASCQLSVKLEMPIRHLHGNRGMLVAAGRSARVGAAGCRVHLPPLFGRATGSERVSGPSQGTARLLGEPANRLSRAGSKIPGKA